MNQKKKKKLLVSFGSSKFCTIWQVGTTSSLRCITSDVGQLGLEIKDFFFFKKQSKRRMKTKKDKKNIENLGLTPRIPYAPHSQELMPYTSKATSYFNSLIHCLQMLRYKVFIRSMETSRLIDNVYSCTTLQMISRTNESMHANLSEPLNIKQKSVLSFFCLHQLWVGIIIKDLEGYGVTGSWWFIKAQSYESYGCIRVDF